MLNRKNNDKPSTKFLKIYDIDLSEFKGYYSLNVRPLKNGRIALSLTFNVNRDRVDIIVIDSITKEKITCIPNLNGIFNEKNIYDHLISINELPNGNILLQYYKKGSIVWSSLSHSCIHSTQKIYKLVAEINEDIFALVTDTEINFYKNQKASESKMQQGMPTCFNSLIGSCRAIISLSNNEFILFKGNHTIFYKIKENAITEQARYYEKDRFEFATYLQQSNELFVIRKINVVILKEIINMFFKCLKEIIQNQS